MSDPVDPASATTSAPLNSTVSTLDDILLDTAPVTLSPFTGEHFHLWNFQIQCIFRPRDQLDIAEGNEQYNLDADSWTRVYLKLRDQRAIDILVQTMDRTVVRPLLGATSVHQMWTSLQLHYDKRGISSMHNLQKHFFDLKPTALRGIRVFLSELNDINSHVRDMDTQKVFDDDAVISKVISSFPQNFNCYIPFQRMSKFCDEWKGPQ